MAYIKRVRIGGLAGRRKSIEFELNDGVNIFWGLNGTGKTSLLKILHSALAGDAAPLVNVPFENAEVEIDAGGNLGVLTRTLRRRSPAQEREHAEDEPMLFELAQSPEFFDPQLSRRQLALVRRASGLHWESSKPMPDDRPPYLPHRYLPISRVSEVRGRHQRPTAEMLDEAAFDELFAAQIQEIWRDYNTQALVRIREAQEQGLAEVLSVVLGRPEESEVAKRVDLSSDEAHSLLRQFFAMQRLRLKLPPAKSFAARYQDDPLVRSIVAEIADVQQEVEAAQEPQHRIESLIEDLFVGNKRIQLGARFVSISVGKMQIPLESLSSGEKQMLRILLECVATRSNCILIDEPELSMHVDWQHRLVDCMRTVNPAAQIVLATHSPEVMAELPDSAIFQLGQA